MSSKTDAWMPLWIGDYLADTMALSRSQHGAYLLMLMAYWRNKGPLQDDAESLSAIVKASPDEWPMLEAMLRRFFTVADGFWRHGRADKELAKAITGKAKAVERAEKGAAARWGNRQPPSIPSSIATSKPQAVLAACPSPSPSEKKKRTPPNPRKRGSGECFDDFWLAWPKNERKQDKGKCLDHWRLHNLDDVADKIAADVRTKRGTEKWKDGHIEAPLTYLRGRRWEDGQEPNGALGGGVVTWDRDGRTIEAKGIELGLGPWNRDAFEHDRPGSETFMAYHARVAKAVEAVPA